MDRRAAKTTTGEAAVPLAQRADPLSGGGLADGDEDVLTATSVAQPLLQSTAGEFAQRPAYATGEGAFARGANAGAEAEEAASVSVVAPPENLEDYGVPMADSTWVPEHVAYSRPGWHLVSLLLTAGTVFTLVGLLSTLDEEDTFEDDREPWLIAFSVFIVLYLVEALIAPFCTHSTLKFLCNMEHTGTFDDEHEYFVALRKQPPRLAMHIECYHYETRTRVIRESYKDSNGHTHHRSRVETYQERVVTFRHSEDKRYASWTDLSGAGPRLADVSPKYVGILVNVRKTVEPDDEATEADLEAQARFFRDRYGSRDDHYNYRETVDVTGFRPTVFLHDEARTPFYIGPAAYFVATLLLCSWPYRTYLQTHVMQARFTLRSVVSSRANAFAEIPDAVAQA